MLAARVAAIAVGVAGLTSYPTSAGAATAARTVHGSATVANACSVSILPALIPAPASHRVTVEVASDASPQPHFGRPITLSNTSAEIRIGANLFQSAVDSGFMTDGFTIPATVSLTLTGKPTKEVARTFTQKMTLTFHVASGKARPLVATLQLPNSIWHPLGPDDDIFFSEKSARVALTLDLTATVGATLVHTSTCTPLSVRPFLALGSISGVGPPPPSTSTTEASPSTASIPVTIGPIQAALPHTGSDSGFAVFLACACVATGALLLGLSRRRRPD